VKQVFPFVKCAFLRLDVMGALDGFKKRIIVSDGGPGHFKVYKTQNWMSKWDFNRMEYVFCESWPQFM
jgi:hypothetical protein